MVSMARTMDVVAGNSNIEIVRLNIVSFSPLLYSFVIIRVHGEGLLFSAWSGSRRSQYLFTSVRSRSFSSQRIRNLVLCYFVGRQHPEATVGTNNRMMKPITATTLSSDAECRPILSSCQIVPILFPRRNQHQAKGRSCKETIATVNRVNPG